jgi:hypothetical protein
VRRRVDQSEESSQESERIYRCLRILCLGRKYIEPSHKSGQLPEYVIRVHSEFAAISCLEEPV